VHFPFPHPCRRQVQALFVLAGISFAASATGAETVEAVGLRCTIEHAILVGFDGRARVISDAPAAFDLERAVPRAPVVREPPLRGLDYYEERSVIPRLALNEALFAARTDELRSDDGFIYTQSDVVLRLLGDGRFVATGLARTDHRPEGAVAVYTGKCFPGRSSAGAG
jgi:hypothetical protein